MQWSYSKANIFQQCQRKWFYGEIMAQWNAKDPLRREIHLLKQCKSIYAWRGSLVDTVIEKLIIPRMIFRKSLPTDTETISFAMALADKQLEFGRQNKHREIGMTGKKAGDAYCAFFDIEYNKGLNDELISQMKDEIKKALLNLLHSDILKDILRNATKLIAQRNLLTKFEEYNVTSKPDLIAFYNDKPPLIIDWKVHEGRNTDYWLQLGIYAFVLSLADPHNDYKDILPKGKYLPQEYKIIEFQLLKNITKEYHLTEQDILDIEDHIHSTASVMLSLCGSENSFDVSFYASTDYPNLCASCEYQKACWEVANDKN